MCPIAHIRGFKDVLGVGLGLDPHVLLSKSLCMLLEVGVLLMNG